jgi:1,4-dihydroxy-2-naphthoyl-CoA hydrolase
MFEHPRIIRFADTDAAGVVYFARLLSLCHEAYEASLQLTGIDIGEFFCPGAIAVPIVHTSADFYRPLRCGDVVIIGLTSTQTSADGFEVSYEIRQESGVVAAIALTRHVCIEAVTRQRHPLPAALCHWLQAVNLSAVSPTVVVPSD